MRRRLTRTYPKQVNATRLAYLDRYVANRIPNTEEGWKLQTAQEKDWTNERSGHLDPTPREGNELTRSNLQQIVDEPEFKTYRHQNRFFRIGINVDGTSNGNEGELPQVE